MDLVPKLGQRRRVLSEVAIGPAIMPDQVAEEVFADTNETEAASGPFDTEPTANAAKP